jgi:hypothetical protein
VAFEQLYYTSCERGVGGYAGFQFNALSQGAGARVRREVEQLTVYELPSWDTSPADAPVNLCHIRDQARGGDITANVVYAGTDFSGRSGNYFAHALFTEHPERDFGGLLPYGRAPRPTARRCPRSGPRRRAVHSTGPPWPRSWPPRTMPRPSWPGCFLWSTRRSTAAVP